MAASAPVRVRGHGAGRPTRYPCVAERATALKARVLRARAWNLVVLQDAGKNCPVIICVAYNFRTAKVHTGSGPTLIDRRLLPVDTPLQPLGDLAKMFHDVNRGLLPIVGAVCLGVTLGGQTSYC